MLRSFTLALLLLPILVSCQSVGYNDLLKQPVPPPDRRLAYGPDPLQFGELRLPKAPGRRPVAILIHGGCWSDRLPGLDPRATSYDLLRPMADALAQAGIATWNIEFRRFGNRGGGFPGTFSDLSTATDFLRGLAPIYGLDLTRTIALGHSSGGQLALWLAARPKLTSQSPLYKPSPLHISGVVDLDGPPDLAATQPFEQQICAVPAISRFLGGTPSQQPGRYHDTSAASFLPLGVPQEILGGPLIDIVRRQTISYAGAAQAQGDRVNLTRLFASGHFDMLSPTSLYWHTVLAHIKALLEPRK